MSTYNDIDITCEECGHEFRGTIWTAIHAGQDPELKDLMLGGELNLVMCPECAHVAYQDHFVLYQDPSAEIIAYIYPEIQAGQAEDLRQRMMEGFQEAKMFYENERPITYEPILVFGLESFIEMMRAEDDRAEQSQIAEIICGENNIPMIRLTPNQARALTTVRVLPTTGETKNATREEVLKGIKRLLEINPELSLYASLKKQIEADKAWHPKARPAAAQPKP